MKLTNSTVSDFKFKVASKWHNNCKKYNALDH